MRRSLGALALLVCIWTLAGAALADDFTIPPTPTRFVTDNASALSSDTVEKVDKELKDYQQSTGHQVIVWIGDTTGDVPLETWTGDTARKWKVGRRGHDDGAILFLFMKDHKIRIEVGYGLESSLTDADSSRIINDVIRPRMRSGDVDGAVSAGVAAMLTTISKDYTGVTPPPSESGSTAGSGFAIFMIIIFVLVFGFVGFMIIFAIVGSIRYNYLVMREGPKKAKDDMHGWSFGGTSFSGGSSSSSDDSFSSSSDDFDSGGGDFGGGGASGSW